MEFLRSAKRSFEQFDVDDSNALEYREVMNLVSRLCKNLTLPPIEDETLLHIFKKYDIEQDGHLSLEEFIQFDKYYPNRDVAVRREHFVGRHPLTPDHGIHGGGSFGEVYLVKEKQCGKIATLRVCKMIDKSQAAVPLEQIEAEIIVLKRLDHPNIIKIYDIYEDETYVYIIMEYCQGGELLKKILDLSAEGQVMTEFYVATIMFQMFKALSYFHKQNIVHKDLKPENILFHDSANPLSTVKVIDFGLAEIFHQTSVKKHETGCEGEDTCNCRTESVYSHNAAGTVLYMAPEVFQRRLHLKCDVWSAGCLMYLMLTGHLPYSGKSVGEIRYKVLSSDQELPKYLRDGYLSEDATDLLKSCLTKNIKQRPSAQQVLEHRWFKRVLGLQEVFSLPEKYLHNFRKISKINELKLSILNLIAHQLDLINEEVQEISRIFIHLDTDHDGTLSIDELRNALVRPDDSITPWEFNRIFQILDIDNDGQISFTEFLAAAYSWKQSEINLVWMTFNKLDSQGHGKLKVDDLTKVLSSAASSSGGPNSPGASANRIANLTAAVRKLDKNKDGMIDWNEFVEFIRGK